MKRRGQVVVAAVLLIALYVMSILVMVYQAHAVFLQTRSPVAREIVASITGDFQRALAAMLAVATRAYFNYSRFSDLTGRFSNFGMSYYNRHNFTVARQVAKTFLEYWRQSVTKAYAEYGIQVSYSLERLDVSQYLNRSRAVYDLMKGYWYLPASGSYAYAKLRMNLTRLGLYNWESDVLVGLTVRVYRTPVSYSLPSSSSKGNVSLTINVLFDRGEYYGNLLAKGWVEIYYPEKVGSTYTGRWLKATIKDVRYDGMGNYTITFEPYVDILTDPLNGQRYVPVMVVVSDERGVLVEASAYNYIGFAIQKNTPSILYYYNSTTRSYAQVPRNSTTPFEVYTLEMSSNLSLYWLGNRLTVDPSLKLPPFPIMPIKQIRVNATLDGTRNTLREVPIQYENWTTVSWYGVNVDVPVGLADPQMDFVKGDRFNTRLVFQASYPSVTLKEQLVVLWWSDDLDAEPASYPTQIKFYYNQTHKDVWHPLYDVEFVDTEHQQARNYYNYYGVAALVLRDSYTGGAFGPYNLHAFDVYGSSLGRYRPYGKWEIYYQYMRYSWIQAPIRIFAVLNTTRVGNVYSSGDIRSDYYYTLAIVQIVNNTRYIPVTTYIYWSTTRSGEGYWLASMMGAGQADRFVYLNWSQTSSRINSTSSTPFAWGTDQDGRSDSVYHLSNPGFLLAMWGSGFGRALYLNIKGLQTFYAVGRNEMFACTMTAPGGAKQGSLEYVLWPYYNSYTVNSGTRLNFTTVIFDFRLSGTGWISCTGDSCWKNAYIYAPMFLEKYAPSVAPP
ncbi:hypothetical protein [Infirmifilum sp. NZ]|uniref:hypothetical protein n=1 Tax=Infirmifilum sp. NZ TaxID=2926850 RepID=UPI00279EDE95|nr:hypothetical protein [Infirmifilum sp. NZ]UNQ72939.1 hypothetical protein MOV14_07455 [Infirmifilum sp. NZ]